MLKKYYGNEELVKIPFFIHSIGCEAFYDNKDVKKVVMSNQVKLIGNRAFAGCDNLQSIELPNSITNIHEFAFSCCNNLTQIVIPNSVKEIQEFAFYACKSLKKVIFEKGSHLESLETNVFCTCENLIDVVMPDSVKIIKMGALAQCKSLKEIVVPNGTKTICKGSFYYSDGLLYVYLPNSISYMEEINGLGIFEGCPKVTVLTNNPYVINYCNKNNISYKNN